MDVGWDYKLSASQASNPVVLVESVKLPESLYFFPTDDHLKAVFKTDSFVDGSSRLKAWGRGKDKDNKIIYENNPHWIAVRNGTPLHLDPPYPRYSHHLKIRVDEGMCVRGLDKIALKLKRGVFYVLDTHSPHQVINTSEKDGWNVAVSFDSWDVWKASLAIDMCTNFIRKNKFIPE